MPNSMIKTRTGKWVDVFNPTPEMFCIEDIAHALSNLCRFNGHCKKFYSVAEHSVHLSHSFQDTDFCRWALLHDSAEAYIGDLVTPVKHSGTFKKVFVPLEKQLLRVISIKFGLSGTRVPGPVSERDKRVLNYELDKCLGHYEPDWYTIPISYWKPKKAKKEFMARYKELLIA